jgi:hypothetical protein
MSLFRIESSLAAANHHEILERRRLVTPLFYVRLKPNRYIFCKGAYGYLFGIKLKVSAGWFHCKKSGQERCDPEKSNQLISFMQTELGESDKKVVQIR